MVVTPPPYPNGIKHSVVISEIILKFGPLFSFEAEISKKTNSSTSFSLKILIALIGSPT